MTHDLTVRFLGVRGSIATPGAEHDRRWQHVVRRGTRRRHAHHPRRGHGPAHARQRAHGAEHPRHSTILLSHLHWDHIAGLPFFTPVYVPGHRVEIASGPNGVMPLDAGDPRAVHARRSSRSTSTTSAARSRRASCAANDRVHDRRHHRSRWRSSTTPIRSTAFGSSTAASRSCTRPTPSTSRASIRRCKKLAAGADILIYDAQYTPEEYPAKVGWGHSTWRPARARARRGRAAARAVPPRSGPHRRAARRDRGAPRARRCRARSRRARASCSTRATRSVPPRRDAQLVRC